MDNLTPHDLDQLSSLIADALQVVDHDKGPNMGPTRVRPGPRDVEEEELNDGGEEVNEEAARDEEEKLLKNTPTTKPQQSAPAIAPAALQGNFMVIYFALFLHNYQQVLNTSWKPHIYMIV